MLAARDLGAQNGSIAGRVTDAESGLPVAGAEVSVAALGIGALTQQNGSYLLLAVPEGTLRVDVERIGYRATSLDVALGAGETLTLNFRLSQEALQLDEIIVTGTPGGTRRRALGNTVSTVDASAVAQNVAITNLQDLLTARSGGLQFTRRSGNVGTGSAMTIRGTGSFDLLRNQPLVYVDGVRVNNNPMAGPLIANGRQANVLDDFNPEDIESVEIIKGPAAASLYGTEASAGVIQIITKRGLVGSPQLNVSIRQGMNYMPDPAGRLGTQWTCPTDPTPGPGPTADCQTEDELVAYNMYDEANRYIREGYFPWPTEDLFQSGYAQSYNLDVRGGTQSVRYFLSAGYESEEGIVWYNTDEAFRLRANVGVVFSEHASLDLTTGYANGRSRFEVPAPGDGGLWQDMVWSNGYYLDRVTPFDQPGANPRLGGFQEHLPSDVAEVEATRDYARFTGSATLNVTTGALDVGGMTAALTSRAVLGLDRGWDTNRNLYPREADPVPAHLSAYLSTWNAVYGQTQSGQMGYERPIHLELTADYALIANLRVNDRLGLETSFGAQYHRRQDDFFANRGTGFASPLSTTINQLAQAQIRTEYSFVENESLGVYVQEQASWNDRLFVTGALRFDDNSTFGDDAPPRRYPKLSAAWVVSDESFWNVGLVRSLRLRGAWGKAGRQPDAISGRNTYAVSRGPGGTSAIRPASAGNPAIEPEVSTELEVGFDVAFLGDRLSGTFTHYWRKNEQLLSSVPVASSIGVPGSVQQNIGRIDNWGWEAQLAVRLYESDAFSFHATLAADHTANEVEESRPGALGALGLPIPFQFTQNWVVSAEFDPNPSGPCAVPGGCDRTNAFGRRITAYCDPGISRAPADPSLTQAEIDRYARVPGGTPELCGSIPDRFLVVGPAYPTYTFRVAPTIGLLGNTLQLFALAEGQYGQWSAALDRSFSHFYNNSRVSRLENDPVWVYGESNTVNDARVRALFDADFWKLREVGARYTLPEAWVRRMGVERASLGLSARNLWTIWQAQEDIYGVPIGDPELGGFSPTNLSGNAAHETPGFASVNVTLRMTF